MRRAPSSRTCRQAPPMGFCAARLRPAYQAPPLPTGSARPVSPGPWSPSARRAGRRASPSFCKFFAPMERAAQVRSLPPSPPPRSVLLQSSRRLRAEGCLSERLRSPSSLSFQFYSIVYYLLGAGAKGREGRLELRDSRRRRPVSARRGLTRKPRSEWRRGAGLRGHARVETMTSSVCTRRTSLVQGRGVTSLE